jgi:hypothetical protein
MWLGGGEHVRSISAVVVKMPSFPFLNQVAQITAMMPLHPNNMSIWKSPIADRHSRKRYESVLGEISCEKKVSHIDEKIRGNC